MRARTVTSGCRCGRRVRPRRTDRMNNEMTDFTLAVEQGGRAAGDLAGGDPQPYVSLWAQDDDVTIFGAWGAYEQGWQAVEPRLDWAAARVASGGTTQEILSMGSSGDLGYTVALERGQVLLAGESVAATMLLRVT